MSSYNKVILMGNLTRDPEERDAGGTTVAALGIAASRKYRTRDGEDREEVCFVDCEAWGKTAEVICKYFQKGKPILIEGRLKLDQWESQAGEKRSKLKVVVEQFSFVNDGGGRRDDDGGLGESRSSGGGGEQSEFDDEDIPF